MSSFQTPPSPAVARYPLGVGGPLVAPVALGCSGFSVGPATPDRDEQAMAVIRAAVQSGLNLIDTADFYGSGHNETLVGQAVRGLNRDDYVLTTKFGGLTDPSGRFVGVDGRPAAVKNYLAYSLRRLGTDHVDTYRPARLDPGVPIEETVGAIAEMVQAGYVRHIGLSEVSAETIRRAHAVHPISDVQMEYAIVTRGPERSVIDACRSLGIGMTAYGVLSHGLLTGAMAVDAAGAPGHLPRLHGDNRIRNLALVDRLRPIAQEVGISVAQLAIAWVLAKGGERHDIVAIVGAGSPGRMPANVEAANTRLSPDVVDRIEAAIPPAEVAGTRYAAPLMAMLDSEKDLGWLHD